jgi:hypothetical protein
LWRLRQNTLYNDFKRDFENNLKNDILNNGLIKFLEKLKINCCQKSNSLSKHLVLQTYCGIQTREQKISFSKIFKALL